MIELIASGIKVLDRAVLSRAYWAAGVKENNNISPKKEINKNNQKKLWTKDEIIFLKFKKTTIKTINHQIFQL